jgi:DNA-directed RNA polymerase specialized sigma24 family protein
MTDLVPATGTAKQHQQELEFLRTRMAALARGRHSRDLEDLAMEAWVRWDRYRRREQAQNAEAMMSRIARFVWIDFVRAAGRIPLPIDLEGLDIVAPEDDPGVDPQALALLRFAILEHFARHAPKCHALAEHYFEGRNWFQVAELVREKRDAIAKRWQRCVEQLILLLRDDPGDLGRILAALGPS